MLFKAARRKKVINASHVECPNCTNVHSAETWNDWAQQTYGNQAPDIRKAGADKNNSFPFQCPSCYKAFSAYRMNFHKQTMDADTKDECAANWRTSES